MPIIDVIFPVRGASLPTDHLYPLYAALKQIVPAFADDSVPLRFAPIPGQFSGRGLLQLTELSRLRLRLPAENIATVLPLAGRGLTVANQRIRLGVPHVRALTGAPALAARVVTFKHSMEPESFQGVVQQKLSELGVTGTASIPCFQAGSRSGEPRRQVVRIKGCRVIGFALRITDLPAEGSLRLQEKGLGGRRRMGCGFFLPFMDREGSR